MFCDMLFALVDTYAKNSIDDFESIYIKSRMFPGRVGRDHGFWLATIQTSLTLIPTKFGFRVEIRLKSLVAILLNTVVKYKANLQG